MLSLPKKHKQISKSLIIALFISGIFLAIFSKELFYSKNILYAFEDYSFLTDYPSKEYSEEELNVLKESVELKGYDLSDNKFTSTNNDPQIIYHFDKTTLNQVQIILKSTSNEDINVTVYFSRDGNFNEIDAVNGVLRSGTNELLLSFDDLDLTDLRIDIGSTQNTNFELDRIILCRDFLNLTSFNHFLLLQFVFFISFFMMFLRETGYQYERLANSKLLKFSNKLKSSADIYKFKNTLECKETNWKMLLVLVVFFIPICILVLGNDFIFIKQGFSNGITYDSIEMFIESINKIHLFVLLFLLITFSAIVYKHKRYLFHYLYKYRYLIGVFIIVIGVLYEVSGSSIASWYEFSLIPQEEKPNILYGISRIIRSDEWAVNTPMAISQTINNHGTFEYFSHVIRGTLTDVFMVYGQPVMDPVIIFRPFMIGYLFLGASRGLSFFWISRMVFLFLITFDFFRIIITDGNKKISLIASFMILFMPVIQWWFAVNGLVEMFIFGQLAVICIYKYMRINSFKLRLLHSSVFFMCAGGYIMTLYPAQMVPLFYVFLGLTIAIIIVGWKEFEFSYKKDFLTILIPMIVFCILMLHVMSNSLETISSVMNTAYPGNRIANEGNKLSELGTYISSLFLPYTSEGLVGNSSEMSRGIDFFPLGIVLTCYWLLKSKKIDWISVFILSFSCLLMLYSADCMPAWLSNLTFLKYSTMTRALVALNLCNIILLIRSVSLFNFKFTNLKKGLILSSFVALNVWMSAKGFESYLNNPMIIISSFVLAVSCYLFLNLLANRCCNLSLAFIAMVMIVAGFPVNPINQGMDFLLDNTLIQEIHKVVKNDLDGLWVMEGSGLFNNTTIMAGAPTINSTNTYPNIARWELLDDSDDAHYIYNRYAHIYIHVTNNATKFELENPDSFVVNLSVNDIIKLNIKYMLTKNDLSIYNNDNIRFIKLKQINDFRIYEIEYL